MNRWKTKRLTRATLMAAESAGDDPWVRLNAMGRGFMRWAFENPTSFKAITHPDVGLYADDDLHAALREFRQAVRDAVAAAQAAGRHPEADLEVLTLFTRSVPLGASILLSHPLLTDTLNELDQEELIEQIIELVVPIADRG